MLTLLSPSRKCAIYWLVAMTIALWLGVSDIWAAPSNMVEGAENITGFLDSIALEFERTAKGWELAFRRAATYVFRVLLVIDLIYVSFDVLFLRGEDIRTWAGEVLRQVLIIGFFSWVLFNSADIADVLFKGFEQLAGIAGGPAAIDASSPSRILDMGLRNSEKMKASMLGFDGLIALAKAMFATVFTGGMYGWLVMAVTIVIIIVYCMIACRVLITQVETYIALTCGIIVLALGGARWTREPAIRYCWFLLALALKLFTIYMLVSVGDSMMNGLFFNTPPGSLKESVSMWFMVVGILLIWLVILWVIPNSVAQLVSHIGGVGGGGAAGASAAAGLIGGSLAFAGSSVSTAVKGAATVATPATAGGGLAVAAAIAAGEKAMQAGVGVTSRMASQAGGVGQGRSGSSRGLGGIAKNIGPGSSGTSPMSNPSPRSAKSSGGASKSSASGGAAASSTAASAGTAALGGIAKGITGTVSGAASLGARGDLGAAKSADANLNPTYRPKENLRQNKP